MDHMRRGTIDMGLVKMLVLDEADEMLDMGFREDIEFVLDYIPDERQILLFSATMSPDILYITRRYQEIPRIFEGCTQKNLQYQKPSRSILKSKKK